MKVNLWKSGSGAGRPKSGHQSIRGKISAPIPIPSPMDDDEFPIRKPGTGIASTTQDDEFPMRSPGARVASTTPLEAPETREEQPIQPAPTGASTGAAVSASNSEVVRESTPEPTTSNSGPESRPATPPADPSFSGPAPAPEPAAADASAPQQTVDLPSAPPSAPPPAPPQPPQPPTPVPSAIPDTAPQRETVKASPPRSSPPRTSPPTKTSPPRRASPARRASPSRRLSPTRISPPIRRTNPANTARYSAVSAASTGHTGHSKDGPPQRKKSTLRSALGRLFGRKKKSPSQSSSEVGRISGMVTSQHRSDPTALSRVKEKESEPKRSASLPITEFDRALRSHSVGPEDIATIEEVRNSMQGESSPNRRRAATTNSRLFIRPRVHTGEWGLSPRPASSHGRGGQPQSAGPEDPNEIGRAITSDNVADRNRRRSRSMSGLQDVVEGHGEVRRRSDEIRFWRESYDPGFMSPLSSNAHEDMDGDNDDTGVMDVSLPESPAVERPPKTPPQPFNFGSITNEMVGMKITQAASMETRIGSLETRIHSLERVVDQLCHSVPGFKIPLRQPADKAGPSSQLSPTSEPVFAYTSAVPPMIPAIYQTISEDLKGSSHYSSSRHSGEDDSHSQVSFGEAPTYIGSLYPPSSSATQAQSLTTTAPPAQVLPANRPTSTSTVRGATSMPSIGRETGAGSEQYAGLLSQLEAERAARQTLEAQVKKLSERLNVLSSTLFTMVRDPQKSRSQERLTVAPPSPSAALAPIRAPSHKALSVFETDDDDDGASDAGKKAGPKPGQAMRRSGDDDEDFSESFQTPREERPQLYGAFGEELREEEDDGKRKKAARTLSLSQLTLGKGVVPQI